MRRDRTPSQTVGPYLSIGMDWGPAGASAVASGGLTVGGRVFDGNGCPVPDALIETWQCRPDGLARCPTGPTGEWSIVTARPAALPVPDGDTEAPHLNVTIFARGLLLHLFTRIYFADEDAANAADPVLRSLPDDAARSTLIAMAVDGGYHLDIHLQGERETVFFRA